MKESDVLSVLYPRAGGKGPWSEGGPVRGRRFTQDTAILPEVWIGYATKPGSRRALLLTPNSESSVSALVQALRKALARERKTEERKVFIAYNESHVWADLTFEEVVRAALPLSYWWAQNFRAVPLQRQLATLEAATGSLKELLLDPGEQVSGIAPDMLDLVRIAGAIYLNEAPGESEQYWTQVVASFKQLFAGFEAPPPAETPPLWSVFACREAQGAVSQSRIAVKADAAIRLFELSCKDLVWAVIDSGIDAEHPAFLDWPSLDPRATSGACSPPAPKSRVLRSYDFTRIKRIQEAAFAENSIEALQDLSPQMEEAELRAIAEDLGPRLIAGRPLDWNLLEPLLRVRPAANGKVPAPANEHGTHVAGILAADWRKLRDGEKPPYPDYAEPRDSVIGICPDLRLYDLRVIGPKGTGDEFSVLSALQFVRYLNMNKDKMMVHGVNLSFSLPQLVKSFACGSTPVCQECERLVNAGVVVVTAAGNRGYAAGQDGFEWYRNLSITDPGNSDAVITVGSTHRTEPHRYGVSYFSSRGPTGDGRMKPDLVAPGEKIRSVVPGSTAVVALDGTSMAAPHVSGAAALLMARHRELVGRPRRVKEVLCSTATDLGRERMFQGAGLLDVLRALQAV